MAAPYLLSAEIAAGGREAVRDAAFHGVELDLFGTRVRLRANRPEPVAAARTELGIFEVPPDPAQPPHADIAALLEELPEPCATFVAGDLAWRLRGEDLAARAGVVLTHLAESRVRSAYLAHAGCVSIAGRGVVIAAPSRLGKSTLTAHLAVRGAGLLSDELAPLERSSGLILPAPFPVGIRPGAGEPLVTGKRTTDYEVCGDRKKLVDVRALTGRQPAEAVRPDVVVFLTQRAQPSVLTLAKHEGRVRLLLTGWSAPLDAALAALPGLIVHSRGEELGLTLLVVEMEDPATGMPALIGLIGEHGVALAGVRLEGLEGPDFDAEPELLRIPAAAGVLEFAKKIFPQQLSEMIRAEHGGRMAPLLAELVRLLRRTAFYKLTPGRLPSMVRAIEGLA